MSDVWDEEYNAVMEEYDNDSIARADYNHRFQVPKDCRWDKVIEQAGGIGRKLNDIFEKSANANSPKLDKIFDDLDFANKDRFPNETTPAPHQSFLPIQFWQHIHQFRSSRRCIRISDQTVRRRCWQKRWRILQLPVKLKKSSWEIVKPHQKRSHLRSNRWLRRLPSRSV